MREEPFEVRVGDGSLVGCAATGGGAPALLLHGGPAIPDYTGQLALELEGLFATMRYTQRGVPPSTVGAPYSIESHMDDALAVLDATRSGLRADRRLWALPVDRAAGRRTPRGRAVFSRPVSPRPHTRSSQPLTTFGRSGRASHWW